MAVSPWTVRVRFSHPYPLRKSWSYREKIAALSFYVSAPRLSHHLIFTYSIDKNNLDFYNKVDTLFLKTPHKNFSSISLSLLSPQEIEEWSQNLVFNFITICPAYFSNPERFLSSFFSGSNFLFKRGLKKSIRKALLAPIFIVPNTRNSFDLICLLKTPFLYLYDAARLETVIPRPFILKDELDPVFLSFLEDHYSSFIDQIVNGKVDLPKLFKLFENKKSDFVNPILNRIISSYIEFSLQELISFIDEINTPYFNTFNEKYHDLYSKTVISTFKNKEVFLAMNFTKDVVNTACETPFISQYLLKYIISSSVLSFWKFKPIDPILSLTSYSFVERTIDKAVSSDLLKEEDYITTYVLPYFYRNYSDELYNKVISTIDNYFQCSRLFTITLQDLYNWSRQQASS